MQAGSSSRAELTILQSIFEIGFDGRATIRCITSVPLGGERGFFPVKEDILVVQPDYVSTIRATLGQSIVPIVAVLPKDNLVKCLGTGFFISCSGLLITAAHVIADPIDRKYGGMEELDKHNWAMGDVAMGVLIRLNPVFYQQETYSFCQIEWAAFLGQRLEHPFLAKQDTLKLTSDTAICQVVPRPDGTPYQPLSIIQPGIRGIGLGVGKGATVIGYSGMKDFPYTLKPGAERSMAFDLHVSTGNVLEHFPDNAEQKSVPTPGACFSASLKLPPGMSGSPIFDDERIYVHGVVSRGLEDENGLAEFGYGTMLGHSLNVPLKPLLGKTLLDILRESASGMVKMSIPDA